MEKTRKLALAIFLSAVLILPMLATFAQHSSSAWSVLGSSEGTAIIGTVVSAGWAVGLLCGVQLLAGIVIAG
ncbi:MAG: hypothetical protein AB1775_06215 [Bacteroidota bacterium]